jgi:hypothetical protein
VSAAWDLDPQRFEELALRVAPELVLKAGGASFRGIFYVGLASRGDSFYEQHLAYVGGLLQASYLIGELVEVAARYAVVRTDQTMLEDAQLRADYILAHATDPERERLFARYGDAGTLEQTQEATLGANLYLFGHSLKLQGDATWQIRSLQANQRHAAKLRLQLQLAY